MITAKAHRVVLSLLIAIVLVLSSAVVAFAGSEAQFSLTDAQVQNGRLFKVTLRAKTDAELSSFVCELLYDSQVLKFNSAEVLEGEAEYSVSTLEDGKATAVYLCEEGVVCTKGTSLMTFTFKAIETGNTQIKLSVKDAIASDLADVAVSECVPSKVMVLGASTSGTENRKGKNATANNADTQNLSSTDESKISFINGRTDIAGLSISNQTLVSFALSFLCTLCVAVYLAYRLGAHRQKEKQKSVPLAFKDNTGNDELSD